MSGEGKKMAEATKTPAIRKEEKERLKEVGNRQRNILLLVFILLILSIFLPETLWQMLTDSSLLWPIRALITLTLFWNCYKLARAVHGSFPWLWLILLIIPLTSLFALIALMIKATNTLKAAGLRVGLVGYDPKELDKKFG